MFPLKKSLFCLLIAAVVSGTAADLKAVLHNKVIPVGYRVQLSLISDTGDYPETVSLPRIENLHWLGEEGHSSNTRIINFSVSRESSTSVGFYVEKPGKYTVPPFEVRVGRKTLKTPELTFEAVNSRQAVQQTIPQTVSRPRYQEREPETSRSSNLDSALFAKMSIGGKNHQRKVFYAGEAIPLVINTYIAANIQCSPSYPEIKVPSNAVLQNTGRVNPQNPSFEPPEQSRVRVDRTIYHLLTFRTSLRSFVPGQLPVSMEMPVEVTVRDTGRSRRSDPFGIFDDDDDDFFSMTSSFFGGRRVRHIIRAKLDGLEIRPLPENRTGAHFLGLVGEWKTTASLSSVQGAAGSAVTLRLLLTGTGGSSMLKAPVLEFSGFRTYPAEIERRDGQIEIRYILIPLEKGVHPVSLKTAVFNPVSGKYEVTSFQKNFAASEAEKLMGNVPESRVVDSSGEPKNNESAAERKKVQGTDVLYLKRPPFHTLTYPLWRNSFAWQFLLILTGLLFFVICELVYRRRKSMENDPDHVRKHDARKNRSRLIADLKQASPEDVGELSGRILAYVNDMAGLPAGTTLEEAASAMEKRDPELAEGLRTLTVNSWAPGMTTLSEEKKKALVRGLSRLALFLILLVPCSMSGADDSGRAMTAYDTGKNDAAFRCYRAMEKPGTLSPEIHYNMGNCLFRQGKYAAASAEYETALRLAPRDRDILENLNLTKRKLRLPEKRTMEQPSDVPAVIRDLFRPDEWLTVCAFGIMLLLAAGGLRRFAEKAVVLPVLLSGLLLVLFALSMTVWQSGTSYASDRAIVVGKNLSLFTLPSVDSSKLKELRLTPGEELSVIEKRPGWIRVRLGTSEGWIPEGEVQLLP